MPAARLGVCRGGKGQILSLSTDMALAFLLSNTSTFKAANDILDSSLTVVGGTVSCCPCSFFSRIRSLLEFFQPPLVHFGAGMRY